MDEDKPRGNERRALGREVGRGMRGPLRWWFLATVVVVALIGTYFFGKAASLAETRGEFTLWGSPDSSSDESATADDSGIWQISESSDPMTDATVRQAFATFEGNQFDIEVSVTCSSNGDVTYTATSFDKNHEGAPMRSRTIPFGYSAGVHVDYQLRTDDEPPVSLVTTNPPYTNQVQLRPGTGGVDAEKVAGASRVVMRLFMTTGEETIELPQSDAAFRSVVDPCVQQYQAEQQQAAVDKTQADAKTRADDIAYIDSLYDDAGVSADILAFAASNRNVPVDEARLEAKRKREANLKVRPESDSVIQAM
jgi:hypothetical protein